MAKTKAGKKKVYVRDYTRGLSFVRKHYRSTPNPRSSGSGSLFGSLLKVLFGKK